jgi:hypothetical protein
LDIAAVRSALDRIKEESRERLQKEAQEQAGPDLDEVIDSLTAAMGDSEEQAELKKEAALARREDLLMAKWLAGLDALASLEP